MSIDADSKVGTFFLCETDISKQRKEILLGLVGYCGTGETDLRQEGERDVPSTAFQPRFITLNILRGLHPNTAKPSEPVRGICLSILGKVARLPSTVQYGIWGQMVGLSAGSIAG